MNLIPLCVGFMCLLTERVCSAHVPSCENILLLEIVDSLI